VIDESVFSAEVGEVSQGNKSHLNGGYRREYQENYPEAN
jgi:hypothetical protein